MNNVTQEEIKDLGEPVLLRCGMQGVKCLLRASWMLLVPAHPRVGLIEHEILACDICLEKEKGTVRADGGCVSYRPLTPRCQADGCFAESRISYGFGGVMLYCEPCSRWRFKLDKLLVGDGFLPEEKWITHGWRAFARPCGHRFTVDGEKRR